MTLCNMSIEGGARAGYVNPDETTFAYLKGRPVRAAGRRVGSRGRAGGARWRRTRTPRTTTRVTLDGAALEPHVTWGINPGQSDGRLRARPAGRPTPAPDARAQIAEALEYMGFSGGEPIAGTKIDVAFIGSCTNGRLSDLREAARVVKGRKVAKGVKALAVPGSNAVRAAAEREGLDARLPRRRASSGAARAARCASR